jgi:uncharacterized repeat protein (TIGR03803 family)
MNRGLSVFAVAFVLAAVASGAEAQTLNIVHNFTGGKDGANPDDGFTMSPTGILYGTASGGGAQGAGVVFRITANGKEAVMHDFGVGTDGATPNGGVILDGSGALYGTTAGGGDSGSGAVFKIDRMHESVLYSFAGGTDGSSPQAALAMDADGNLYGTTSAGGMSGNGTVFELVAPKKKNGKWKEVVLYSFGAGPDGAVPLAGVTFDAAGNLYGTTSVGGTDGFGTIFQLKHDGTKWTEKVLHGFQNADDGAYPYAGFVADSHGVLYGAATQGGVQGGGTIFTLTQTKNGAWKFAVITSVPGWGISGSFRNLLLDEAGNIYGTTHCDGDDSAGTIFKLAPSGKSWTYTLLYTFTGGSDGQFTISNLVLKNGALYGTTLNGGQDGAGVVYKLTP